MTPKPKHLSMLKKEVEFTPSTPPNPKRVSQLGLGIPRGGPVFSKPAARDRNVRTIDEKKEILGTMLGNVDALVEGVRKAGIWGLKG